MLCWYSNTSVKSHPFLNLFIHISAHSLEKFVLFVDRFIDALGKEKKGKTQRRS